MTTDPRPNAGGTLVRPVDPAADGRWDAFVAAHPRAMPAHLGAWAPLLERAYRLRTRSLILEDGDGAVRGVFPLAIRSGPVTGARLASLPLVPGPLGPLGEDRADETALLAAACQMADADGVGLRFRSRVGDYANGNGPLAMTPASPSYVLALPGDADELRQGWKRQSHLGRNLRRAEKAGLVAREGHGDDDLRAFHRMYLRNMAKHGAVPHSRRFFALSRALLVPRGAFVLVMVEMDGTPVGATVSYAVGDTLEAVFAVSDDRYRDVRPSYAVWWETIRAAIERGLRTFDFGSAGPGSQADFKAQWGTDQVPAFDYAYPAVSSPDGALAPDARSSLAARLRRWGGAGLRATVWQRAPAPVRAAAGEAFYRYL